MAAEQFWSFIKDHILSLITVLVGVTVLVLQGLGMAPPQTISNTTLALVALLATSGIVERQRHFAKIEGMFNETKDALTKNLDKLLVKEFSDVETEEYTRYLIRTSKKSIVWVTPEPRRSTPADTKRAYEDALVQIVKQGKVGFTWITHFDGKSRVERARKLIFEIKNPRVFVGHFLQGTRGLPQFPFIIIDETILLTRAPYRPGSKGKYLALTSPSVVRLFTDYCNLLLEHAQRLDATEETRKFLDDVLKNSSDNQINT